MFKLIYMSFVSILLHYIKYAAARFCDGGHICSLPRECCPQGCCPPYHSGPRQLPAPSEHVLSLFFVSHWYFWCVVVAIVLAILCAYSLWKKRRTLCGWGLSDLHNAQSEGDSAGSCYAPPQYSRCNSFHHHPPPPYTEVTSKPDLYPLVFTCNTDNGKNGSLMVQYFRNYIVRPGGSLSAASTMDSLSSSFICNVNEMNTLVPPPYSRAASPENGSTTSHLQLHHGATYMPRSASQLVCYSNNDHANINQQQLQLHHQQQSTQLTQQQIHQQPQVRSFTVLAAADIMNNGRRDQHQQQQQCYPKNGVETTNLQNMEAQPRSEQYMHYMTNSNNSISDIFVNTSCAAAIGGGSSNSQSDIAAGVGIDATASMIAGINSINVLNGDIGDRSTTVLLAQRSFSPPYGYKSSSSNASTHALQRASTNPRFIEINRNALLYNSCNSISGISLAVPAATDSVVANAGSIDLQLLRRSLETCCQLLQQQQQQQQQLQQLNQQQQSQPRLHLQQYTNGSNKLNSIIDINEKADDNVAGNSVDEGSVGVGDESVMVNSGGRRPITHEPISVEGLRSIVTSSTCSGVSSLANLGTPSSPPQATSPTGEVKEILDQIRQLQQDANFEEEGTVRHAAFTTTNAVSVNQLQYFTSLLEEKEHDNVIGSINDGPSSSKVEQRYSELSAKQRSTSFTSRMGIHTSNGNSSSYSTGSGFGIGGNKRPSSLQQTKCKFYYAAAKPNKALYIPMRNTNLWPLSVSSSSSSATATQYVNRSLLKSPVGTGFFSNRGRLRKGWISRSAPTTPSTTLPHYIDGADDDSPLLLNHEEEQQQGEHNIEIV